MGWKDLGVAFDRIRTSAGAVIPSGARLVLLILAEHSIRGTVRISLSAIAELASLTAHSVRKHLRWLEANGEIVRSGPASLPKYHLRLPVKE